MNSMAFEHVLSDFIKVEIPVSESRDVRWRSGSMHSREVFAHNNDMVFVPSNLFFFFLSFFKSES